MKYITRYQGAFVARNATTWHIQIQMREDVYLPPIGTSDLTFEGDEPATIEWDAKEKEEPLQGSSLTLNIESPGDRTYIDLYTVSPTAVRVVVSKETLDNVFWVGMLDPEFYEEPYEKLDKYPVTLTFTDFGVFQRLKPKLTTPINSVEAYILDAMEQAGMADIWGTPEHRHQTFVKHGDAYENVTQGCHVRLANFTDEEGETLSYTEIIEGLLQPLGLRMIQRGGKVILYDLHSIATGYRTGDSTVYWNADTQTLSTDKVANNIKITFSPYGDSEVLNEEIEADDIKDNIDEGIAPRRIVYDSLDGSTETEAEKEDDEFEYLEGFEFHIGKLKDPSQFTKGVLSDKAEVFYNKPIFTDTDDAGIVTMYPKYLEIQGTPGQVVSTTMHQEMWGPFLTDSLPVLGGTVTEPQMCHTWGANPTTWDTPVELFRTNPVPVSVGGHELKITLPVNFEGRYNPWNSSGEYNGSIYIWGRRYNGRDYTERLDKFCWVYVPVKIIVRGNDGSVWHFVNKELSYFTYNGGTNYSRRFQHTAARCYWAQGEGDWKECFLSYYDFNDREKRSGVMSGGWSENRPICCNYFDPLPSSWDKKGEGEFIPAPPVNGDLTIVVGTGAVFFTSESGVSYPISGNISLSVIKVEMPFLRWMMYQLPKVEVVNATTGEGVECDDIEFTGTVNEQALEDIELDTICGTGAPSFARGLYLYKDLKGAISPADIFHRAGREECAEQLLIGTMFSQYHDRCLMLTGEADIDCGDTIAQYHDAASPDIPFMMKGEVMDLQANTSELILVEVRPDTWTSEN